MKLEERLAQIAGLGIKITADSFNPKDERIEDYELLGAYEDGTKLEFVYQSVENFRCVPDTNNPSYQMLLEEFGWRSEFHPEHKLLDGNGIQLKGEMHRIVDFDNNRQFYFTLPSRQYFDKE